MKLYQIYTLSIIHETPHKNKIFRLIVLNLSISLIGARLYHKFDTRRNRSFTVVFAYLALKFQPTFSKF